MSMDYGLWKYCQAEGRKSDTGAGEGNHGMASHQMIRLKWMTNPENPHVAEEIRDIYSIYGREILITKRWSMPDGPGPRKNNLKKEITRRGRSQPVGPLELRFAQL